MHRTNSEQQNGDSLFRGLQILPIRFPQIVFAGLTCSMISPKLYKKSGTYNFFLKMLGFEGSIDRYLHNIEMPTPEHMRVLDAGCGTGVLGLHFLERVPQSRLLATDLEPNFLKATLENAKQRGIDRQRIEVGVADISAPDQLTSLEGESRSLDANSFDVVCVGAVVGYAGDTEASMKKLIQLLSPGGVFVNIEMNEKLTGRFVSHRYHYRNISLDQMQRVLRDEGCHVNESRLALKHMPASLTRTAIIARKPGLQRGEGPVSHAG